MKKTIRSWAKIEDVIVFGIKDLDEKITKKEFKKLARKGHFINCKYTAVW